MTTAAFSFERYLNVRSAYGSSFSADGKRLSFLSDISGVAEVWSVAVDMTAETPPWPQQLTFRGERVAEAKFSPVDERLIVKADSNGSELTQLYLLSGDGSTLTALTEQADCIFESAHWSPDGKRVAYRSNERERRFFDVYERDLESGKTRMLLCHDGFSLPMHYAPDGNQLVISLVESNTRNRLLLLDRTTGETRFLTPEVHEGAAEHAHVHWSADRRGLYLVSNRGCQFLSPAYLDLATADMTYLAHAGWDVEALAMTDDGARMALVTNENGCSRLEVFDVSQGWEARAELPTPSAALPKGILREVSWSRDGKRLACTLDCADDASDIWVWDPDGQQLWRATRSAMGGIPRSSFVAPVLVRYPTFDGLEIPAFLFLPRSEQAHNLPMVVYVHGGPESQFRPLYNPVIQYLVAHGYGVLAPNVRGSTGYGYEYQSLDDVRLRMNSVADLQHAVFWLRDNGVADPERIAVMGGSYGGFMALSALTTYPELWAAGVDIVGIANFVTFMEHTGPWRRKYRETEYGSLEHDREFLEQISPIRLVDRITAPLFVVHGANDPRVPVGEAEQIVAALRARHVPVEYMRFEDEGHGLVKRANRLIAYPAIARFLDNYVREKT